MENMEITLAPIDPALDLPESGEYVLVLSTFGVVRYAFWHTGFESFHFLGGKYCLSEVRCWYRLPQVAHVSQT